MIWRATFSRRQAQDGRTAFAVEADTWDGAVAALRHLLRGALLPRVYVVLGGGSRPRRVELGG